MWYVIFKTEIWTLGASRSDDRDSLQGRSFRSREQPRITGAALETIHRRYAVRIAAAATIIAANTQRYVTFSLLVADKTN